MKRIGDRPLTPAERTARYRSKHPSSKSVEFLRSVLHYNPETGSLVWRYDFLGYKAGEEAGHTRPNGTRMIDFGDKQRAASPLVWAIHTGEFPKGRVCMHNRYAEHNLRIDNLYVPVGKSPKKHRKAKHARTSDVLRDQNLQTVYGITLKQYIERLEAQNGVCAICKTPETSIYRGRLRNLAVDHCHMSNNIRDLLCTCCNAMLGMCKDNADILRTAADYLDRHKKQIDNVIRMKVT